MQPTYQFQHTNGFRAQRFRCPLLFPQPTGQTCDHAQFAKAKGCVKDPNWEKGGLMRALLDRVNASTVKLSHWALNGPKCAMAALSLISTRLFISSLMYALSNERNRSIKDFYKCISLDPPTGSLSPTLFRNAGQSATVDGADARVSTGVRRHRTPHAHYHVSRADPGAASPYRADHGDHSASAAHDAHRRPPGASTTRRPGTTPVTDGRSDPGSAHGSTPTASHDVSCPGRSTRPACASESA
jgi:hypothetical protein